MKRCLAVIPIAFVTSLCASQAFAGDRDLRRFCLQKINDDTVRKIPKSAAAIAYVSIYGSQLKDFSNIERNLNAPISPENPNLPMFPDLTYYRCMSGLVFVCSIMANGACLRKADISLNRPDLKQFCLEHPNENPSQAQIGHGNFYDWDCLDGKLKVNLGNRIDQRHFIADSWEPLVSEKRLEKFSHR